MLNPEMMKLNLNSRVPPNWGGGVHGQKMFIRSYSSNALTLLQDVSTTVISYYVADHSDNQENKLSL